jgi:hypothetical protein
VIIVTPPPTATSPASVSPSPGLDYCVEASPGVHAVIQAIKDSKLEGLGDLVESTATTVRAIADAAPSGTREQVLLRFITLDLSKMRLDLAAAPALSGLEALLRTDAALQTASANADATFGC